MFYWQVFFNDTIVQRGIKLNENKQVKSITITEDGLTASVQGHELYTVKIDRDFSSMSCNCPCGFNCKHMVAVMLACQESADAEVVRFWEKADGSPLANAAADRKDIYEARQVAEQERKRKDAEREARRIQQILDAPRIQAEKEEKKRLAEQRRIEREKHEAEVAARREERERKRLEKLKAEEAKRKAREEEWTRKQAEWEAYKKAHQAEWEAAEKERQRQQRLREAKKEEQARLAEPRRQKRLDREAREKLMKLPPDIKKQVKKELREVDERIAILEEAEREPELPFDDDLMNHQTMQETGWYYPEPKIEEED